jgi:ABC-2 type transport system ATP-binding protein
LRELDARGVVVQDVGLRRPTLDDVFLSLTGHVAEEEPAAENGGRKSRRPEELEEVGS